MLYRFVKAAFLLAVSFAAAGSGHAQSLPSLVATNFGSFPLRDQTSLVNNNPGFNSSYSLVGGGDELWGATDKGLFAFFQTNGNFDVRVRVESLENVHRYAKSGLMVRESLSSASRMVSLFATPTGPTELPANTTGQDEVEFNFRRASGDGSNNINLGSPGFPNAWLRLARRGNIVYGLVSRDGTNWTRSASVDTSNWLGGPLRPNVLLGLGSSSHDDNRLVRSELRDFSQVTSVGPTQILNQPANVVAISGSPATLGVTVTDPVDARFQWFTNGSLVAGATNSTYGIANPVDQTKYSVTITGANGAFVSSQEALVSVVSIDPPEFPRAYFDFDDGDLPIGTLAYGTAEIDPSTGSGGSGGLVLARAVNQQNGSFIVQDLNPGEVVTGFTVAFKLKIGPGSARPADGFSFSFGPNVPNAVFPSPQQGVAGGLAVSFDIYDNGDLEAPAIDVFYGVDPAITPLNFTGNLLHHKMDLADLVTSRYVDVLIRMNPDGKLDLIYNGQVIAYQLQTPFVPTANGKFGFGAYAGGQNAFHGIDDLRIDTTTSNNEAYLVSLLPLGNNVSATPVIRAELLDMATAVVPGSVQLFLNSASVTPTIQRDPLIGGTIVTYSVPNLLPAGSTNTVRLVWEDDSGHRQTNNATFRVGGYGTLPSGTVTAPGSGAASERGFNVLIYQIQTNLTANSAFAESVLAGHRGDNVADLTIADETGLFTDPMNTSLIDYDANSAPIGLSTFPGIPGLTDSKENFVSEITAFIEFPSAGFYQMGVRSDDGFILYSGGQALGSFEGEREPADTIFGFVVPQAGVYPFRLVYYQRGGGAKVRWFSLSASGDQSLINAESELALRAYRSRTGGGTPQGPQIVISRSGGNIALNWSGGGTLESADALHPAAWTPVAGATSPYVAPSTTGRKFFRVRQ